jgi:hypothetical protein
MTDMSRPEISYSAECWCRLEDAERKLRDVMSKPGRSDEALDKARQAVDKAEGAHQKFRDGRCY